MVAHESVTPRRPLVLVFGGLDPSGAGLQADIETCFALGCHALPIATGLTIQSTRGLERVIPTAPADITAQMNVLLADVGPVAACKIGMLPSLEVALLLGELLACLPAEAPVILDPVMMASAGGTLMAPSLQARLPPELLARTTLIKPNLGEALRLTGAGTAAEAGARLCGEKPLPSHALITGGDAPMDGYVLHQLFRQGQWHAEFRSPHLTGHFHGTGCTLSSAIAARCALGAPLESAVGEALEFTANSVRQAYSIGGAQGIPERRAWLAGESS